MSIDHHHLFTFVPLSSLEAKKILPSTLLRENTMILIENFSTAKQRRWIRGRAAFRIFWVIGGAWKWLGSLCFLPFGVDAAYRLVASFRHHIRKLGE